MNHVALLLSRLEKVRTTGKQKWKACCPAHDDKSPSLSIGVGDKGQVLLHCFAGCTVDAILAAIDSGVLGIADLYPPDSRYAQTGQGLQTNRPPMPTWARPGNDERLRRAVACLFLLCADAYPEGSPSRSLAAFAMGEASEVLGGVI